MSDFTDEQRRHKAMRIARQRAAGLPVSLPCKSDAHETAAYVPTPDEIKEVCAEIQKEWTPLQRRNATVPAFRNPPVQLPGDHDYQGLSDKQLLSSLIHNGKDDPYQQFLENNARRKKGRRKVR